MAASGDAADEAGAAQAAAGGPWALHARSFKLRFSAQRELGRSYVSAVQPRPLPAAVAGKFYGREQPAEAPPQTLRQVQRVFSRGPRDAHAAPVTTSHEYGWWAARSEEATLRWPIRDSAWLKARLRVLADDTRARR